MMKIRFQVEKKYNCGPENFELITRRNKLYKKQQRFKTVKAITMPEQQEEEPARKIRKLNSASNGQE